MSQNNPPFAIGQKIVRIGRSIDPVVKGNIYTCAEFEQCPKCGNWKVGLLEFPNDQNYPPGTCKCGHEFITKDRYLKGRAEMFAPIQSNYSDATAEILEKFKSPEECPDKIIVPEKVTNHL